MKDMNNKPLISVLLPVYNVEKYIGRCIESLMKQTYSNIEIIIVDDCTPDHSGEIAEKYAKKDTRIKVFHHEKNLGLSGARNTGLDKCSGDYITFVDSDDWVKKDYIEYLYQIINTTNADIAMVRTFFTSRFSKQVEEDHICTITPEDMLCDIFYNRIHEGVWNRLYKRSVIGERRFRLESLTGEGMQYNTNVIPHAKLIGVGLHRIYVYNVDNDMSATKAPNIKKQAYGSVENMEYIKKNLIPRNKRLDNAIEYQCFTTALYALIHLVRSERIDEHRQFYIKLVVYCKRTAMRSLKWELSTKQKMKSICTFFDPLITVKLAIIWRYRLNHKQKI